MVRVVNRKYNWELESREDGNYNLTMHEKIGNGHLAPRGVTTVESVHAGIFKICDEIIKEFEDGGPFTEYALSELRPEILKGA